MGACGSTVNEQDLDEVEAAELQKNMSRADSDFDVDVEDVGVAVDEDISKTLERVPLLAKLKKEEREKLAGAMVEREYRQGAKIVIEGDVGDEFFILKSGKCVATKIDLEKKLETELATLKPFDFFGESSLRTADKRAATIAAMERVTVLCLTRDKFESLFGDNKLNFKFAKRVAVSAEAYDPEREEKEQRPAGAISTKTPEQFSRCMQVVNTNTLFEIMNDGQRTQCVEAMWKQDVKAGENIISQGDIGEAFYVVESGRFDIFIKNVGKVAERGPGGSFGELALLYNAPRAATVTAMCDSTVWALDRGTFRKLLTAERRQKMNDYQSFLTQVKDFTVLLSEERGKIAEALEEVSFPDGHDIVREGEDGDTFFILKKGEVVVIKEFPEGPKEVARYFSGDSFGEKSLIVNEPRGATCRTVGPAECLYLKRRAFAMLLGPLEDIFVERIENYKKVTGKTTDPVKSTGGVLEKSKSSSTKHLKSASNDNELEDFTTKDIDITKLTVIGTLGKGSFGHVQLVKDDNGKTYALKIVSKSQAVKLGQQEHIMSEKRVMAALQHPFLIRLYSTAKDQDRLYFLLEPSLGGELFSVLRARTYFDEATARFFSASVILAFEYMHSKNIIYRDLKPENLLLDNQGYLKITDFGFAKVVKDRTWTLCGTPDYLAPEVVSGQGHNKGVDWWTLGILIYEMLASYPPFYDEDPMKTYANIMHGQLAFPVHFSKPAVDLIRRLLHHKPTKRLGVVKGGAKTVKEHPWFKGFDWNAFFDRKLKAPIVQTVKDAEDLSNFEEYPPEDEVCEPYTGDDDWDADF